MIYNLAVTFSVNLNFSHGLTVAGRVLLDFYLSLSILGVNVYAVINVNGGASLFCSVLGLYT